MNTERLDIARVDLSPKNPFGLTFQAPDKNRSLFIEEPQKFGEGTTVEAQDLLRTVMLAHLTAKYFPKIIETNFKVEGKMVLDELYTHYGYGRPVIVRGTEIIKPAVAGVGTDNKEKILFANAHSGGLASIYRVAKILSEGKKVSMVHIRNLNQKEAFNEAVASRMQAAEFNVPYQQIRLRNGGNGGFQVMKTRDMLIGLISAITVEPNGTKKVFIEGDMRKDSGSHFSEYANAWIFFNKLIRDVGLNSQIEGMDAHDIETVGEVIKLEEKLGIDLIPMVQNCFSATRQVGNNRRKWERETPVIAENSTVHWCGSCIKCRRMTLGRIYYNDPRLKGISKKEINYFVEDTYKWLKNYPNNS